MKASWIYLEPEILRRGQPVIHFVEKDEKDLVGLWLGTCHTLHDGVYAGTSLIRISQDLYDALVIEARRNESLYNTRLAKRRIQNTDV